MPREPNYLSVYPVNNPDIRAELGQADVEVNVPRLKQSAIRASVEKAFRTYGYNPYHRFGMSDDDPKNVDLIIEEMKSLKTLYPENCFYVIDTSGGRFIKREIYNSYVQSEYFSEEEQLNLV